MFNTSSEHKRTVNNVLPCLPYIYFRGILLPLVCLLALDRNGPKGKSNMWLASMGRKTAWRWLSIYVVIL